MATKPKRGLGAGLGTLIPQSFDNSLLLNEDERIQKVAYVDVEPNKDQPRRHFDEEALQELAASIKLHGILQPIVVSPHAQGKYQIIAGERRWRAAGIAGLKSVPVIVRTLQEQSKLELSIIENVQRVDLAPLEQAISIEKLHQQFGLSYDAIAKQLGKANSTVNNIVRLLQLPTEAQEALNTKNITEGHARAILALKENPEAQKHLLDAIIKNSWSVREAERYVTAHKAGHQATAAKERVQTETPETQALATRLKTAVKVKRTAKGGRLEITFKSDDELQRIIEQLG
ncbi:MAG TPA: ParB/RepB/Spo0J family partition protein [Candidatus Saccharimonadales bacterium]